MWGTRGHAPLNKALGIDQCTYKPQHSIRPLPFRPQVPEHVGSRRCRDAAARCGQVVRQNHVVQEHWQQPPYSRHVSGQVNHGECELVFGLIPCCGRLRFGWLQMERVLIRDCLRATNGDNSCPSNRCPKHGIVNWKQLPYVTVCTILSINIDVGQTTAPCWLCARFHQAVKPAKDLKTFLGNSLGHHGPFPPPCRELDSGWEVRQPTEVPPCLRASSVHCCIRVRSIRL